MQISPKRKRQFIGILVGVVLSVCIQVFLSLPSNESYVSLGPMNTGHEKLTCESCHTKAKGNVFQQVQANLMYTLGKRKSEADFGTENVDTKKCQSCHDRPNDRHPVHRFKEPRFAKARKQIDATNCETCHLEHNGVRLTIDNTVFCQNCHQELELKEDPLDVPHTELIKNAQWTTCLQCHDFHGNHIRKAPEHMKDTLSMETIRKYIKGSASPYGELKKYLAKEKPSDILVENKK